MCTAMPTYIHKNSRLLGRFFLTTRIWRAGRIRGLNPRRPCLLKLQDTEAAAQRTNPGAKEKSCIPGRATAMNRIEGRTEAAPPSRERCYVTVGNRNATTQVTRDREPNQPLAASPRAENNALSPARGSSRCRARGRARPGACWEMQCLKLSHSAPRLFRPSPVQLQVPSRSARS